MCIICHLWVCADSQSKSKGLFLRFCQQKQLIPGFKRTCMASILHHLSIHEQKRGNRLLYFCPIILVPTSDLHDSLRFKYRLSELVWNICKASADLKRGLDDLILWRLLLCFSLCFYFKTPCEDPNVHFAAQTQLSGRKTIFLWPVLCSNTEVLRVAARKASVLSEAITLSGETSYLCVNLLTFWSARIVCMENTLAAYVSEQLLLKWYHVLCKKRPNLSSFFNGETSHNSTFKKSFNL